MSGASSTGMPLLMRKGLGGGAWFLVLWEVLLFGGGGVQAAMAA